MIDLDLIDVLIDRLGLPGTEATINAALEVLEKMTGGKGEVYSVRSGDADILCFRPFGGEPEHLMLYQKED